MTTGSYQMGGGAAPFERSAQDTLAAMQQHARNPQPYRRSLTDEERAEAEEQARQEARVCRLCIGIHPLPNTPGCPRLLTFKLDGDGHVIEGTYRTDNEWRDRVVLLEDAHEDSEEAGDGGN